MHPLAVRGRDDGHTRGTKPERGAKLRGIDRHAAPRQVAAESTAPLRGRPNRISGVLTTSACVVASVRSTVSRPGRAEEKAPVMQTRNVLASVLALALVLGVSATAANAQSKGKSVNNEAKFVSYDAAASTVTVEITDAGKGNAKLKKKFNKEVKRGKEVTFNVIPTGSVLKRTSVAVNGVKGEMTDLKPGKSLQVYWVEDPKKPGELFARKIDVVLSEEELNKRYEVVEE
jgi:hypothetical protein